MEEEGEAEQKEEEALQLPEEMNIVGVDDNIHSKSLQTAIDEVSESEMAGL